MGLNVNVVLRFLQRLERELDLILAGDYARLRLLRLRTVLLAIVSDPPSNLEQTLLSAIAILDESPLEKPE